ncbi:MAG: GMC family oxidoreductase N-terminal domain-containing protein [Gemmatimonadota bacterium]
MSGALTHTADVVVVGSGPGGAAVARRLARGGRSVLVLERGRDWRGHPLYGTYPGALLYADRRALLFTDEGLNVVRPLMVGGATSMYCGCSAPPPAWLAGRWGVDLGAHAARIAAELEVAPLAPELRGAASTRLAEAGRALGMPWEPQDKFMRPARAERFRCGAHCMLGCRCGAKWNAAEWVDDARAVGAVLWTRAHVQRVVIQDGVARGVVGRRAGRPFRVHAEQVVVAAGGIGSALLLRRSGFEEAGRGMAMDTTLMVYGDSPADGMGGDPPMTWSAPDDDLGVLYSTLIDPWLMYPIMLALKRPTAALGWHRWGRTLGVMIKVRDEVSGEVRPDGGLAKGLTRGERARLEAAEEQARRILLEAGCRKDTLINTPLRGTHPSATARLGTLVDTDLATPVPGLHVCDASVFPEALGRPTVLTILALGERLAERLLRGRSG